MPARKRQYPLNYRYEEISYITQRWMHGQSCALVGVGSAGKTNLLQHLLDQPTKTEYLRGDANNLLSIVIDSNLLGPLTPLDQANAVQMRCWSGYELMLHQAFMAAYPFAGLTPAATQRFTESYRALQEGANPLLGYMALRYFELGIGTLIDAGMRLVFVFDEFDEMLRQMPPQFFQALRGLRDAHKKRLSYTVFTRSPLTVLVDRLKLPRQALEPFVELFTDSVRYLGPFNDTDAQAMLAELNQKVSHPWPADVIDALHHATGGYAGMMRAGFSVLPALPHPITNTEDMAKFLVACPAPSTEAETLWKGLTLSEQRILKAVVKLKGYSISKETEQAMHMLVQKRLLRTDKASQQLVIEPPLFREFVRTDSSMVV